MYVLSLYLFFEKILKLCGLDCKKLVESLFARNIRVSHHANGSKLVKFLV